MLKDLSNTKQGKLLIIKPLDKKPKNRTLWECHCDCGIIKNIRYDNLYYNKIESCGCLRIEKNWKGFGEIPGTYFSNIKRTAKKKNRIFTLTQKDLWELFLKQDRRCALTGWPIFFVRNPEPNIYHTASLDRIDSNKGYTLDNVAWVHTDINFLKSNIHSNTFISICNDISSYQSYLKGEGKLHLQKAIGCNNPKPRTFKGRNFSEDNHEQVKDAYEIP